jgi:cysteine synthase
MESVALNEEPFVTRDTGSARIGDTPMVKTRFRINGLWRPIYLKLEGYNPAGSLKDRTAASLISDLEQRGRLNRSSIIDRCRIDLR